MYWAVLGPGLDCGSTSFLEYLKILCGYSTPWVANASLIELATVANSNFVQRKALSPDAKFDYNLNCLLRVTKAS